MDLCERLILFRRGIKLGFKYRMMSYCTWPQFTNLVAVTCLCFSTMNMHHSFVSQMCACLHVYASFDCLFVQTQTLILSSVEFTVYTSVCVCIQRIHQNDKNLRGGSNIKMFPWKSCKLYGALNLFGCCCQANEVSE